MVVPFELTDLCLDAHPQCLFLETCRSLHCDSIAVTYPDLQDRQTEDRSKSVADDVSLQVGTISLQSLPSISKISARQIKISVVQFQDSWRS